MNKFFFFSVVTALFSLTTHVFGQADESVVIEIRTIGIPPYGIQTDTDQRGIYYDLASRLAELSGHESNNYFYPYARIVNELKSGQSDLTIMFKYKELEGHVEYIAQLPALQTVIVGLEESNINSIEDLKGKTIAYLRGAKFGDVIDDDPDILKQDTNDFIQGAEMLVFKRVDAIIGPIDPILSALSEVEGKDFVLSEPIVISERTPWIQVSKKSVDRLDVELLRTLYLEIVARGELDAIFARYSLAR